MGEVMGKRELKKIQARKKIMEAALQQFRENGFQTASVADIMKTADMGLGTFYNYFSSKEDILYCFLDSLAGQLKEHLMSLKEQSRAAILQDMFLTMAKLIAENRFVLPLFLSVGDRAEAGHGGHEHSGHAPAFMDMFLQLVKEGQASGEFRQDISAELITELFHSLFQAAAFSSLKLSCEENISMKLQIIIDGICVK